MFLVMTTNIKTKQSVEKIAKLVQLLSKHKKSPSSALFSRIERDLALLENELKNSYSYILDPTTIDLLIGKIHFMMEKNTRLSNKYYKQKESRLS
jgi:hypothetical protein